MATREILQNHVPTVSRATPYTITQKLLVSQFAVTTVESRLLLGYGIICLEARYSAVRFPDHPDLYRGQATAQEWLEVEKECRTGFEHGVLPRRAATTRLLFPADVIELVTVQLVRESTVMAWPNFQATGTLDRYLCALPIGG